MFTGLVETTGTLRARTPRGPGARLVIECSLGPLALGESVAVDGVCLTVQTIVSGGFEADASHETLARTTLGRLPLGAGVHLERALALGDRLGGHIVSGHVDGVVTVADVRPVGESLFLAFAMDRALAPYVAEKGSVAIDGVSLTVNGVGEAGFDVVIVPHTQVVTKLGRRAPGDACNVEVDVLARYVARMLEVGRAAGGADGALYDKLGAAGFLGGRG